MIVDMDLFHLVEGGEAVRRVTRVTCSSFASRYLTLRVSAIQL